MQDVQVRDIQTLMVMKEGEELHVELKVEIDPSLTVAEADDIKDRLENRILQEKGVTDVIIEFDEDDGIPDWVPSDLQLQKNKNKEENSCFLPCFFSYILFHVRLENLLKLPRS